MKRILSAAFALLLATSLASAEMFSTIGGNGTAVTATSTFGTDNAILRADGTGRGSQSSNVSIDDTGNMDLPDATAIRISTSKAIYGHSGNAAYIQGGGQGAALFSNSQAYFAAGAGLGWSSGAVSSGAADLTLFRDAANTLAQRNGTNAQAFNFYNTYTDASNYERVRFQWSANAFGLISQAAGTGTIRNMTIRAESGGTLTLGGGGINAWTINSSGHFLAGTDNTYDIGASGATRPRNLYVASAVSAGSGAFGGAAGTGTTIGGSGLDLPSNQFLLWHSSSEISAPSDGLLLFRNSAETGFTRLQLGGTTSSFPAIKRNGTAINFRLADDSTGASITAANFITDGAGGAFNVSGRGFVQFAADGVATLLDNAATSFGRLQLGGTTSSFPAIKRNAAAINFRLADDSADAAITAAGATLSSDITVTGNLIRSGRSILSSQADGNWTLWNNAASSFGLLQFGGTTSSFPALKRNGANLEARLADDSAGTGMVITNPTFSAYNAGTQALTDATDTLITVDTELFDVGAKFASNEWCPAWTGAVELTYNVPSVTGTTVAGNVMKARLYRGTTGAETGSTNGPNEQAVLTTTWGGTMVVWQVIAASTDCFRVAVNADTSAGSPTLSIAAVFGGRAF